MSLRRRNKTEPQPPPPIAVIWANPYDLGVRAKPGCCPRCGVFYGRKLRGHSKDCVGKTDPSAA